MISGPLLVIGGHSQIGGVLLETARTNGAVANGTSRRGSLALDLADPKMIAGFVPPQATSAVICAAVTSIDACERDPGGTSLVNVAGAVAIAKRLVDCGIHPIGLSTNLVFDGEAPLRRSEEAPSPRVEYGRQKAEMEQGILALGGTIVRLTKVVVRSTRLWAEWMEDLAAGRPIRPFLDLNMAPIPALCVARALIALATDPKSGMFQLSATRDLSYAEAALALCSAMRCSPSLVQPVLAPPERSRAAMPRHTTLDTGRATSELGWKPMAPDQAFIEGLLA